MNVIKQHTVVYHNAVKSANRRSTDFRHKDLTSIALFNAWLKQYNGRLASNWDIEFDNSEDALKFILKFG